MHRSIKIKAGKLNLYHAHPRRLSIYHLYTQEGAGQVQNILKEVSAA